LREVVPDRAHHSVKELQQARFFSAPIEVAFRVKDLTQLKALSVQVDSILRGIPAPSSATANWRNESV